MKKIIPLIFLLLIPLQSDSMPTNYRGIIDHEIYPFQINEPFHISVPFYFSTATALSYRYEIVNSNGRSTFFADDKTVNIRAGFNYFISHTGKASEFSLGRNYMRLYYRLDSEPWRTYYGYFYGYNAYSNIVINDDGAGSSLLANEARYTYYQQSNSGIIEQMFFDTSAFKFTYTLHNDLYFDLGKLTARFINFERSLSYDGVRVSFSDYSLFPKLPTLAGKKALHLKIIYTNNELRFRPYYQLYVDPKTHIISYEKEPGFILADKIYFPRDKFDTVNNAEVTMTITNFSYGGFTLTYHFQLNVLQKYFGDGGLYEIEVERY
ncbi:MAG TPA: hypothetical protein VFD05_04595 [Bacilli bacterium]|nr:hypothetical protein [Bacilli bacterium]